MSPKIISKLDCATKVKELTEEPSFACHKKQKLGTFENITEILRDFDVSITEIPGLVEKEKRKKWQAEKKQIIESI